MFYQLRQGMNRELLRRKNVVSIADNISRIRIVMHDALLCSVLLQA